MPCKKTLDYGVQDPGRRLKVAPSRWRRSRGWSDRPCHLDPGDQSSLERLSDDAIVATTYGHWTAGAAPWIVSVRFTAVDPDRRAATATPIACPPPHDAGRQ